MEVILIDFEECMHHAIGNEEESCVEEKSKNRYFLLKGSRVVIFVTSFLGSKVIDSDCYNSRLCSARSSRGWNSLSFEEIWLLLLVPMWCLFITQLQTICYSSCLWVCCPHQIVMAHIHRTVSSHNSEWTELLSELFTVGSFSFFYYSLGWILL